VNLWTEEEDCLLKEHYPTVTGRTKTEKCINLANSGVLDRSYKSIEKRIAVLGIGNDFENDNYAGLTWTDEQEEEFRGKLNSISGSINDKCKQIFEEGFYGRSLNSLREKARDIGYEDDEGLRPYWDEIERLRKKNDELVNWWARFDDAILRASLRRPSRLRIKRKETRHTDGKFVTNCLLGDWQIGECFKSGDVLGMWEYNSKIIPQKVDRWIEHFHKIQDALDTGYMPSRIVIDLLGDFIEGIDIYPGQQRYLDLEPFDAMYMACDELARVIGSVAERYPDIPIDIFCVYGNHGRTNKNHHKRSNFDYAVYRNLQRMFLPWRGSKPCEGVNIYVSTGEGLIYEIPEFPGKRHLIFHGDSIRSHLQFPYYGLDRAIGQFAELTGRPPKYTKIGHFHRPSEGGKSGYGKWIVNGSFVGASPFSVGQMRSGSGASQSLFTISAGKIINRADIFLDDEIEIAPDANGICTPVLTMDDWSDVYGVEV
jgi:hypothetical protein